MQLLLRSSSKFLGLGAKAMFLAELPIGASSSTIAMSRGEADIMVIYTSSGSLSVAS